jgi:hypothetical protein
MVVQASSGFLGCARLAGVERQRHRHAEDHQQRPSQPRTLHASLSISTSAMMQILRGAREGLDRFAFAP